MNEEWTDKRLGLGDYPIFNEEYRKGLNEKIKQWYLFQEIGFETPSRFAQRLNAKMNKIMPYYNQLYISELEKINPFINQNYETKTDDVFKKLFDMVRDKTEDRTDKNTLSGEDKNTLSGDDIVKLSGDDSTIKNGTDTTTTTGHDTDANDGEMTTSSAGSDKKKTDYNSKDTSKGLNVTSDTPEGFLQTTTIESNTYANTATKDDTENKRTGDDTTTTTYEKNDTTTTKENKDKEYNENKETTFSTNEKVEYGKQQTTTYGKKETVKYGKISDDILNDIIKEIEKQKDEETRNNIVKSFGFSSVTMSEMLSKWRDTFLNIDSMIIDELSDLFIQVLN